MTNPPNLAPYLHAPAATVGEDTKRIDFLERAMMGKRWAWGYTGKNRVSDFILTQAANGCDESLSFATFRECIDAAIDAARAAGADAGKGTT